MRFFSDRFASKVQSKTFAAVDLYAGAGGLSLGLQWAGIKVVAAVEVDDWAASTYCQNLSDAVVHVGRVSELTEAFFERHRGVEIVVGGPPCQGFSVSASSRRKENDARNQEVFHFLDAAIRLKPSVIVMENVPAMPTVLDPRACWSSILQSTNCVAPAMIPVFITLMPQTSVSLNDDSEFSSSRPVATFLTS